MIIRGGGGVEGEDEQEAAALPPASKLTGLAAIPDDATKPFGQKAMAAVSDHLKQLEKAGRVGG